MKPRLSRNFGIYIKKDQIEDVTRIETALDADKVVDKGMRNFAFTDGVMPLATRIGLGISSRILISRESRAGREVLVSDVDPTDGIVGSLEEVLSVGLGKAACKVTQI